MPEKNSDVYRTELQASAEKDAKEEIDLYMKEENPDEDLNGMELKDTVRVQKRNL